MACAEGEIEMIHLLLQSGADCCLFNDKNELPFQVALDGVRDVVESETARQLNRNRSSQDMVNLAIAGVFKSLPVEIAIMVFERVCRDISNSEFVTISAVLLNQNLLNHMINASDKIYSDIKANFLLDLCKSLLCP